MHVIVQKTDKKWFFRRMPASSRQKKLTNLAQKVNLYRLRHTEHVFDAIRTRWRRARSDIGRPILLRCRPVPLCRTSGVRKRSKIIFTVNEKLMTELFNG